MKCLLKVYLENKMLNNVAVTKVLGKPELAGYFIYTGNDENHAKMQKHDIISYGFSQLEKNMAV